MKKSKLKRARIYSTSSRPTPHYFSRNLLKPDDIHAILKRLAKEKTKDLRNSPNENFALVKD